MSLTKLNSVLKLNISVCCSKMQSLKNLQKIHCERQIGGNTLFLEKIDHMNIFLEIKRLGFVKTNVGFLCNVIS